MMQRSLDWSMSPPSRRTRASRYQRSSKIHRLARLCHRYCRQRTAIYFSTGRSFAPHSRLTWTRKELHSWPILKSPGGWKRKASWYLVATDDKMIPPPAQRFMAKRAGSSIVEVAGSHAIYVSQPNAVAALVEKAAEEVKVEATVN